MSTEHPHPYHESLTLKNFTAFEEASFEFVPGINVFIGENGTGKTHVMKVLYLEQMAYQLPTSEPEFASAKSNANPGISEYFQVKSFAELQRVNRDSDDPFRLAGKYGGSDWTESLSREKIAGSIVGQPASVLINHGVARFANRVPRQVPRPVFIPPFDVMSHTKGMLASIERFELDFDPCFGDLIIWVLSPRLRDQTQVEKRWTPQLNQVLGGELIVDSERFYLQSKIGKQSITLAAEGVRKIALLRRLLEVGALEPGTTLFWDEPEVGLNPKLMDELVKALILLARSGVQIFLTTHSYVILKELDLQIAEDDPIRYFLFEPTESSGTKVTPFDTLSEVHPNPILEQYNDLYDREITRKTGRKRAQ